MHSIEPVHLCMLNGPGPVQGAGGSSPPFMLVPLTPGLTPPAGSLLVQDPSTGMLYDLVRVGGPSSSVSG